MDATDLIPFDDFNNSINDLFFGGGGSSNIFENDIMNQFAVFNSDEHSNKAELFSLL